MHKALISFIFILSAIVIAIAQAPVAITEKDFVRVDADRAKGFAYPYYLYVPPELRDAKGQNGSHTILVLPNNTGQIDDDFAVHEADVKKRMALSGQIASLLKVTVLMPVFPRPKSDWRIYTHALDRDSMVTEKKEYRRFDLQLIAMIDDARERLAKDGLNFDKKVLINGFSAQGMFANRFTFLHPDRVKAAAIGSPGGWPMAPVAKYKGKTLRYPIGVGDFKKVSGSKLNLTELRKVPLFVFVGDQDDNDSVPFDDSYDQQDRDLINPLIGKTPVERWPISQELYKQAGLNAEFKLYPGVKHTVSPEMRNDIRAFLMKYAQ
jgi:dienelactone hydrolase